MTPGLCGFKVKIGCSELYFSGAGALAAEIQNYLADPQETKLKFQSADNRVNGGIPVPDQTEPESETIPGFPNPNRNFGIQRR